MQWRLWQCSDLGAPLLNCHRNCSCCGSRKNDHRRRRLAFIRRMHANSNGRGMMHMLRGQLVCFDMVSATAFVSGAFGGAGITGETVTVRRGEAEGLAAGRTNEVGSHVAGDDAGCSKKGRHEPDSDL